MNETDDAVLPCSEKMSFDTQKAAQAAATVAHHQHGAKLVPYVCRYCSLWHLATKYD